MGQENVNIDKFLCLSHMFHLFLGAAQSALLPFLTIYFRILGLTATQTGIVFGAKALVSFIAAPSWSTCAKGFNKKKLVLLFSLFMLMSANLFLILIPPVDERFPESFCGERNLSNLNFYSPESFLEGNENFTAGITTKTTNGSTIGVTSNPNSTSLSSTTPTVSSTSAVSTTLKSTTATLSTSTRSSQATSQSSTFLPKSSTTSQYNYDYNGEGSASGGSELHQPKFHPKHHRPQSKGHGLTQGELDLLKKYGLDVDKLSSMSDEELNSIADQVLHAYYNKGRTKRDLIITKMRSKFNDLIEKFKLHEYQTFMITLMIVMLGELFAAPYEKLANDCWFEYLDLLDCIEKFGGQKVWQAIGFVLVPTIVTAIVDHTKCILPFGIHHFSIHFFTFAILMAFTFIAAFSYPVSQNKKTAKRSRIGKGLKVLCSDAHALSMTLTVIVLGMASATISNFVMWRLQDLSNQELIMGVAMSVAACSQFLMELIGTGFVKKITHFGAICIALLLLVGRLVLYSFMWNPWLVLIGEATHGLSVSLIWIAVRTYQDFRINPFIMDRSAASVISALYVGVGYASGSMISGLVYDKLGFALLFQGTAGLVLLWGIFFVIFQKVMKKKEKIRYAKLLQEERDADSDESAVYEDDWLEVAMKSDRK